MLPAPPLFPSAGARGRCLVDADEDGRIAWLLPGGTPDSYVLRLLEAGVDAIRACGFEVPPGGVCMGTCPPDVLRLPFVKDLADSADSAEGVDPGWREEVSEALAAAGSPRPFAGDGIAILTPGPEGPFPGSREVLRTAGNEGLIVFRNAWNCPDDGISVRLSTSESMGILSMQAAFGTSTRVLEGECLRVMKRVTEFAPGAVAPWPADDPVAVLSEDGTTDPAAFVCFRLADARSVKFAFEMAGAEGEGRPASPPGAPA